MRFGIRDLYTIVELRLNLSFEKKKKLLQIWRKSFLHFLGNWVADRTMKSRTIQAVPKTFLPAAPFFLFCSAKKGSLSDMLSAMWCKRLDFYTVPQFFFACGAILYYFFFASQKNLSHVLI